MGSRPIDLFLACFELKIDLIIEISNQLFIIVSIAVGKDEEIDSRVSYGEISSRKDRYQ
jgi:hypothetical protein